MTETLALNIIEDLSSEDTLPNTDEIRDRDKDDDVNKENPWINRLIIFLIVICYSGTMFLFFSYDKFWQDRILYKPQGYQIPKLSDFFLLLISLPIIICTKIFFEEYVSDIMYTWCLSSKYKNPFEEENYKLGQIYKKKLSTNLYKVFFFCVTSVLGHFILKDLEFFPAELFGNGDMMNIFKKAPEYLFFEKSEYFNIYYMIGLSFTLTDMIWLLFIYENQSDFYLMILHHSITTSLITFSYIFNYSQIGVIVLYLHDITDILVYLVRIVIKTDAGDRIKLLLCASLLFSIIFFRIYLFGKLIYLVAMHLNDWQRYMTTLWVFKIILLIMHAYWVLQIIYRFLWYFAKNTIEDVGKINRKNR